MQRFLGVVDPRAEPVRPARAPAQPGVIPDHIAKALLRTRNRAVGPEAGEDSVVPVSPEEARLLVDHRGLAGQVLTVEVPRLNGGRR